MGKEMDYVRYFVFFKKKVIIVSFSFDVVDWLHKKKC